MSHRSARGLLALTLAVVAIAGCKTPAQSTLTATSGSTALVVPVASAAPAARPSPASSPGAVNADAGGHVQLVNLPQNATPVQFQTQSDGQLIMVASSATAGLEGGLASVSANGGAAASHLRVQNLAPALSMPYRSSFREWKLPPRPVAIPRHVLDTATPALGASGQFWINTGDSTDGSDVQETCTLKRITPHALIYLDNRTGSDGRTITDAELDQLATQWENQIYPNEAAVWGTVPTPHIDGQDRVYIVISGAVDDWGAQKGLMGYFWSRDATPSSGDPHSNQKDVLFMTDALFHYPQLTSFGTMAHEYQHMVNFTTKAGHNNYTLREDTWLDEGMAMYAMEVAGYGLAKGDAEIAKDLDGFEKQPALYSLSDWSANPNGFAYGQAYIFVHYLCERYGQGVIKEILASNKTGVDCIDEVLSHHGDTFANFFRAWTIANYASAMPFAQGTPYHYANLDLAANYGGFQLHGFQAVAQSGSTPVTPNLMPWGSTYISYNASAPQIWNINFADPGGTPLVGAAISP